MNELYLMVTITERARAKQFLALFARHNAAVALSALGAGTARSELLDYFGLEKTEKAVTFCVVTRSTWRGVKGAMQRELNIDVPGTGIAFIIPLSSIGGKKPLAFLTDGQDFEAG
ncbi:MAG: P-II family nitrogen regulator, partial [Oscillospiraceae bacterium]|nr:P-II family nitrogen regulator [Oscillospiraceae bacterium]